MEEEEIAEVISEHGWYAADVNDADRPFLYTIGLMQSWDHPELIILGLESDRGYDILAAMVDDIRGGRSYRQPGSYLGVLAGDHQIAVRLVDATQHPLYLGYAMGYCRYMGRPGALQALQVFWPDKAGMFPFDVGCDIDVYRCQPRLDLKLTPSETRAFRRQWE